MKEFLAERGEERQKVEEKEGGLKQRGKGQFEEGGK